MKTTDIIIQNLADALCKAEIKKQSIPPLTNTHPDLTPKWAYQIQLEIIKRKIREGRSVVGEKIGITSKGIQEMLEMFCPRDTYNSIWCEKYSIQLIAKKLKKPVLPTHLRLPLADKNTRL